jgi:hypothetical protein
MIVKDDHASGAKIYGPADKGAKANGHKATSTFPEHFVSEVAVGSVEVDCVQPFDRKIPKKSDHVALHAGISQVERSARECFTLSSKHSISRRGDPATHFGDTYRAIDCIRIGGDNAAQ